MTSNNWGTATVVTTGAPRVAGSSESLTVTGLKGETTHHFMLRAVDESGNNGALSNDAAAITAPVAPAAITNLAAQMTVTGSTASVTLTWTAPGDDGTEGTASAYDVRYGNTAITGTTFAAATAATAGKPSAAGGTDSVVIGGLAQNKTFYFAVKTVDD